MESVKRNRNFKRIQQKRKLMKRARFVGLCLATLFVFISFYKSNFTFKTTKYKVSSPEIPNAFDGFKIAQISDLHASKFGTEQDKIIEVLKEENVDLIVFTGDLISRNTSKLEEFAQSLKKMIRMFPSYYIPGNHELSRNNDKKYKEFLKDLKNEGMVLLGNRTIPIYKRGSNIYLSGLNEGLSFYKGKSKNKSIPVESMVTAPERSKFSILLAHNPFYFDSYMNWGADLVLSGHVHGGAIRLPFIGGILSPEVGLFPKYDKGIYDRGLQKMIVSVGMGDSFPGFRLFNQKELVIVELESQSIK